MTGARRRWHNFFVVPARKFKIAFTRCLSSCSNAAEHVQGEDFPDSVGLSADATITLNTGVDVNPIVIDSATMHRTVYDDALRETPF